MSLNELLGDEVVQGVIEEKLAAGQKFEVICLATGEKKVFGGSEKDGKL